MILLDANLLIYAHDLTSPFHAPARRWIEEVGPLVMDAHLAALAIEHDAVLYTTDGDFNQFPGLRYVNPLRPMTS